MMVTVFGIFKFAISASHIDNYIQLSMHTVSNVQSTLNYSNDTYNYMDYENMESTANDGRKTPLKYSSPHCIVRFSPTGQLVKVI